ncbi:DUF4145 domain-containing protein [Pseudomonas sp. Sample_14]|uniref:DUF4145 domain-containing protein n=1 Tax=Pseudomonas sp. Sample_14 TaxID=2448262 RepID=UPI001032BCD0|nr:DUF4145 domain-containing protein [Pseudomonas sp. Sample_14]
MAYNWRCPYCSHASTITAENQSVGFHYFEHNNSLGKELGFQIVSTVCPNNDCKEVTLNASFGHTQYVGGRTRLAAPIIQNWALKPSSSAVVFPDYVPDPIRQDYEEACAILNLSPKASATLSRRCLQGIIRDYWKIVKGRLVDEIIALEDKIDPDTWAAIDAVRKIGNIGAHMEKDINIIVEVDPEEAQLLLELIETLIKDWYIARFKRQAHLAKIKAAADNK